uniref:OB domain-containing protein n=1 Tax=Leersia perrieri TaxID=77586 RepID=A0A0D9WBY9_9ORYZ
MEEGGHAGSRPVVLQVTGVRRQVGDRYFVILSDGSAEVAQGILASSMNHLVRAGAIRTGSVIRLLDYLCNLIDVIGSTNDVRPHPSYLQPSPIPIITPIAELSPYKGKWKIKARVTAKSAIWHFANRFGETKTFFFDLRDALDGEIRAKCFSSAVDKFCDLIEVDKVYLISRGSVRPAQKGHNPFNSAYDLTLDITASIEICSSDDM